MPKTKKSNVRNAIEKKKLPTVKNQNILLDIQSKISKSPAMNGGFDTLLYKVDKIEESQGQIHDKIELIHSAIYHHEDGLFSKLHVAKTDQVKAISDLEKRLTEVKLNSEYTSKTVAKEEQSSDELEEKLKKATDELEKIRDWKSNIVLAFKWVGGTIGAGTITLLFKFLYDYLHH